MVRSWLQALSSSNVTVKETYYKANIKATYVYSSLAMTDCYLLYGTNFAEYPRNLYLAFQVIR
jgi:hypothetical protein